MLLVKENNKLLVQDTPDIVTMLNDIKAWVKYLEDCNERLRKENAELKSKNYKDKEIQKLNRKIDELSGDLGRGFPIRVWEWENLQRQLMQHNTIFESNKMIKYPAHQIVRYEFLPTEIGTVKRAYCRCGECFTFSDI